MLNEYEVSKYKQQFNKNALEGVPMVVDGIVEQVNIPFIGYYNLHLLLEDHFKHDYEGDEAFGDTNGWELDYWYNCKIKGKAYLSYGSLLRGTLSFGLNNEQ